MSISLNPQQATAAPVRDLPTPDARSERPQVEDRAPATSADAARLDVSDATKRQLAVDDVAAQNKAASATALDAATAAQLTESISAQINSEPGAAKQAHAFDPQRVAALLT